MVGCSALAKAAARRGARAASVVHQLTLPSETLLSWSLLVRCTTAVEGDDALARAAVPARTSAAHASAARRVEEEAMV